MALIVSAASGNFNAGATWVGGVVPGGSDEGQAANGHTITITANATCGEISNSGTGKFVLNSGVTLTANVTNKSAANNAYCLEFSAVTPATATLIGNCTAGIGSFSNKDAVRNISSGTLVIQGNCLGGTTTGGGEAGASNTGIGTINIFGNCQGGNAGSGGLGCKNSTTGTLNIQGNVIGGAGANAFGASNTSAGTLNITGTVFGGTGVTSHGVNNGSTGTVTITGTVTAGSSTANGAFQGSSGTLSVIGTVTASQTAAGVAGANVLQQTILSGPFLTETVRGVAPVYCAAWRWNASLSNSTYMEVMTNNLLAKRSLYTADNITGMPAASNVKSGIAYGPSSELTGTFSQSVTPSTADIATAVWGHASRTITEGGITAADVWNAASRTITGGTVTTLTNAPSVPTPSAIADEVWNRQASAITTTNSIGERVKNTATTAILGNLLAQANS